MLVDLHLVDVAGLLLLVVNGRNEQGILFLLGLVKVTLTGRALRDSQACDHKVTVEPPSTRNWQPLSNTGSEQKAACGPSIGVACS